MSEKKHLVQRVAFRVDATVLDRLGLELVSKQETALAELVKNAYDADATRVEVIFDLTGSGSISIDDNGSGMSADDLINGFLRISGSPKESSPRSPRLQRYRAGRKGIGRFAAQRLGHELTVTTQAIDAVEAYQIHIQWDRFVAGTDLDEVLVDVERVPPRPAGTGTTLAITALRDEWTDARVRRAYRYIMGLLRPSWADAPAAADTFDVEFLKGEAAGEIEIIDEESMFLDHAVARVTLRIEERSAEARVVSTRYAVDDDLSSVLDVWQSGSGERDFHVSMVAYYFIGNDKGMPKHLRAKVRDLLSEAGGIRLYRNGFRVPPYGDRGDDWLGLDESYRQRVILSPHGNQSWYGVVAVSDEGNSVLNETSSREGVIDNATFESLRTVVHTTLIAAASRMATARGKKAKASGKARQSRSDSLRDIAASLIASATDTAPDRNESASDNSDGIGAISPAEDRLTTGAVAVGAVAAQVLNRIADEIEEEESLLLSQIEALRVLASLGQTIGHFTHEVRQLLLAIRADIKSVLRFGATAGDSTLVRLNENVGALSTWAGYFDSTFADNAALEVEPLWLDQVVAEFAKASGARFSRSGVHIRIDLDARKRTVPMHRSEWVSILWNLTLNAERAILAAGPTKREIFIQTSSPPDGEIVLTVSDTGTGVPAENWDRVFEPFFTTTRVSGRADSATTPVQGTGLGLTIVRDIVEGRGGEVAIVTALADYATTVRVAVPSEEPGQ